MRLRKTCSPRWLGVVALAVLALGLSGCPALMLGSLGYEGYEYEKTGQLPGMPPQGVTQEPDAQPSPIDVQPSPTTDDVQ